MSGLVAAWSWFAKPMFSTVRLDPLGSINTLAFLCTKPFHSKSGGIRWAYKGLVLAQQVGPQGTYIANHVTIHGAGLLGLVSGDLVELRNAVLNGLDDVCLKL